METQDLIESYQKLVAKADKAFQKVVKEHPSCVKCRVHCAECCHALFGVFPIEAAVLKEKFDMLPRKERRKALLRAESADRELRRIEVRMNMAEDDPPLKAMALARARVACPLLNESLECILYPYRPITCRVYGIPTAIQGKGHVCGKAAFKKGEKYFTFDLDTAHRELYHLSKEYMKRLANRDSEAASLLLSISRVIRGPWDEMRAGARSEMRAPRQKAREKEQGDVDPLFERT